MKGGCKECGCGNRFTTDEYVIGLENGKVVRTRNLRPKSLEDSWKFDEIDQVNGQPWDPSVTLSYEQLAQERFLWIEDPTPAEEEYVHKPRSHMIKKADLIRKVYGVAGLQGHEGR